MNDNVGLNHLHNDICIDNINVKNCNYNDNNNKNCNKNNGNDKHKIHCVNGVMECVYFMCLGNFQMTVITCFNCKRENQKKRNKSNMN